MGHGLELLRCSQTRSCPAFWPCRYCTYEIDRQNRERIGRVSDREAGKRADYYPVSVISIRSLLASTEGCYSLPFNTIPTVSQLGPDCDWLVKVFPFFLFSSFLLSVLGVFKVNFLRRKKQLDLFCEIC